ncbi:MAG: hypothetical protein JOZ28_01595 [Candidatus Eremiobacteraeota bacterium]|nr:hypothetical protein [Candidatus Eremiobacteraeota bacterium]
MNERTRSWFVVLSCAALAVAGYMLFMKPFLRQEPELDKVLKARSTWDISMQVYRQRGPISQEAYRISNDNGATKMFYSATNADGTVTKWFDVPLAGPTPTFLFQQLDADGVWILDDKPVRPHSTEQYIVAVAQTLGDEGGNRAVGFSDPLFWATTKAQEFQIRLPAKSMHGLDLTQVASAGRPLRDTRYLTVVRAIETFGPQSVLDAEEKIRSELRTIPTKRTAPAPHH